MNSEQWLAIAVIIRPHALRGAVQLKPYTRTVDEFLGAPIKRVYLRDRSRILHPLHLQSMGLHKGLPLVTFREISDRTAAEGLKGMEIVIPAEERWELPEGSFFPGELDGFEVISKLTGDKLGTVLRLESGPAHDHLVFTHPHREGDEVMLPKVEAFVHEVSLADHRVLVTLPEGLLEL
ncbi:MAG: 16S rRNA processing protein RimM [Candidatus Sumerlaeia bacterium]|nr:16S rRNA processing protein RimM [Candidatus Sumerlaeia bacterium]